MKYDRFEDLPVWQAAADLAVQVFAWSSHEWFRGKGDLSNQVQRAALSVSNNIAEGFERGTTNELIAYLYIARGSAGEVRSMLAVMKRMTNFTMLAPEIDRYQAECVQISRLLSGWLQSLQNSNIQGQRHLNEESKRRYDGEQRRKAFLDSNAERMKEIEAKILEDQRKRNLADRKSVV